MLQLIDNTPISTLMIVMIAIAMALRLFIVEHRVARYRGRK